MKFRNILKVSFPFLAIPLFHSLHGLVSQPQYKSDIAVFSESRSFECWHFLSKVDFVKLKGHLFAAMSTRINILFHTNLFQ